MVKVCLKRSVKTQWKEALLKLTAIYMQPGNVDFRVFRKQKALPS
jgi:hypothetical protein